MPNKTPLQIINEQLLEYSCDILQLIYEKNENKKLPLKTVLKEFKDSWNEIELSGNSKATVINNKKSANIPKKEKKIPADKDRCIALKKDLERCGGIKQKTGKNTDLCSLHNRNGANHGYITSRNSDEHVDASNIDNSSSEEDKMSEKSKTSSKKSIKVSPQKKNSYARKTGYLKMTGSNGYGNGEESDELCDLSDD